MVWDLLWLLCICDDGKFSEVLQKKFILFINLDLPLSKYSVCCTIDLIEELLHNAGHIHLFDFNRIASFQDD